VRPFLGKDDGGLGLFGVGGLLGAVSLFYAISRMRSRWPWRLKSIASAVLSTWPQLIEAVRNAQGFQMVENTKFVNDYGHIERIGKLPLYH
jgi:hypothetical protein